MLNRRSRLALLLLPLLAACSQRASSAADAGSAAPGKLLILATGDLSSDTDVCGCKARPMGGVARRAAAMKAKSAGFSGRVVVVDAGDHFFRGTFVGPGEEAQARETARFLAESLKHLGVAAMAVGERDLALGASFLRELGAASGGALLSANLVDGSGARIFEAFTVVERGGAKVGLVGASPVLSEADPGAEVYRRSGLSARPAAPLVAEAAKEARSRGAQVVVALLHLPEMEARTLLEGLPEGTVDLAVVAHDRSATGLQLVGGGKSAFAAPGDRGKWVLAVELELAAGARGVFDRSGAGSARKMLEEIDAQLAALEPAPTPAAEPAALVKPEPVPGPGPADPSKPEARREALPGPGPADRAARSERLRRRRAQVEVEVAREVTSGRHGAVAELLGLDLSEPEDPETLERYRAYQAKLAAIHAREAPAPGALAYAGAAACKACHLPAFQQWSATPHARAWATMERSKQTANLDCVPCHVTGFERPGGPRRIADLAAFVNVGCESCHGPGNAHAKDPQVKLSHGTSVPEEICAECHQAQGDQKPFHYDERLPKVLGPGHGQR